MGFALSHAEPYGEAWSDGGSPEPPNERSEIGGEGVRLLAVQRRLTESGDLVDFRPVIGV
jgi:hypothetical protein